ncbi:MAG: glycerophosphodiester phosphodiesterase [Parvibaculaceae bacterium]|nr:glycerophosphodiester phosphodiesterase [Parvibaculaceae bacterium]
MRPAKFPFLEHEGVLAFAHRGGLSGHPENTMEAFEAAVAQGYRYLETDVHATHDGVLLAFHDDRLDRLTDRQGYIADLDYAEVSKARIGGVYPIPRFDELLASWPQARFNIDPKADRSVLPLVEILSAAGAIERVCVTSFSGRRTRYVREAMGPGLCTGLGPLGTMRLRFSSWSGPLRGLWGGFAEGCAQIPVEERGIPLADRSLIDRAHEAGLQVHVWTIDDPAEMARLLDLGVDGLMADRLDVLKMVLVERGLWA